MSVAIGHRHSSFAILSAKSKRNTYASGLLLSRTLLESNKLRVDPGRRPLTASGNRMGPWTVSMRFPSIVIEGSFNEISLNFQLQKPAPCHKRVPVSTDKHIHYIYHGCFSESF